MHKVAYGVPRLVCVGALMSCLGACHTAGRESPSGEIHLRLEPSKLRAGQQFSTVLDGATAQKSAGMEGYLEQLTDGKWQRLWIMFPATDFEKTPQSPIDLVKNTEPPGVTPFAFPGDIALVYTVPASVDPGDYRFCRGLFGAHDDDQLFCAVATVVVAP